jgi:hypothetical protein
MKKMMMVFAVFVIALGCITAHSETVVPTRNDMSMFVEVKWMSREDVISTCKELKAWEITPRGRKPVGCNVVYFYKDGTKKGVIIAEHPRVVDDDRTTVLGHETLHLFDGSYHERN